MLPPGAAALAAGRSAAALSRHPARGAGTRMAADGGAAPGLERTIAYFDALRSGAETASDVLSSMREGCATKSTSISRWRRALVPTAAKPRRENALPVQLCVVCLSSVNTCWLIWDRAEDRIGFLSPGRPMFIGPGCGSDLSLAPEASASCSARRHEAFLARWRARAMFPSSFKPATALAAPSIRVLRDGIGAPIQAAEQIRGAQP